MKDWKLVVGVRRQIACPAEMAAECQWRMPFSRRGGFPAAQCESKAKPVDEGKEKVQRAGRWGNAAWTLALNSSFVTFSRREFGFLKRCWNVTTLEGTPAIDVFESMIGCISRLLPPSQSDGQTKWYWSLKPPPFMWADRACPRTTGPVQPDDQQIRGNKQWMLARLRRPHIIVKCSRRMQTTLWKKAKLGWEHRNRLTSSYWFNQEH